MLKFIRIGAFGISILAALAFGYSSAIAAGKGGGRGGGGGAHAGVGARGGGGARMGGGGRHFGGGRPAFSRQVARPGGRSAYRNFARPSGRAVNRAAGRNPNRFGNRANRIDRNAARGGRDVGRDANRSGAAPNAGLDARFNARQNARSNARSASVRNALRGRAVAGALRNRNGLRNHTARAAIASSAALAGWRHGNRGNRQGWWRHRHGGYGWVGPLFWPFAYYDMYDYTLWGYGYDPTFWDYGYNDIYAGLFAPYDYDDLTGYLPQGGARVAAPAQSARPTSAAMDDDSSQLSQMCGDDTRDIAGLPIDKIQQAINPTGEQRAALDDLANASVSAAQKIRAACPGDVALTAPKRLAAMQARVEAMLDAVQTIQPPLEKFYGLLDDEQKARMTALGKRENESPSRENSTDKQQACGTPTNIQWPADEIARKVHPTDAQKASLAALADATTKAADLLAASCQPDTSLTPPARLAAAGKRLDALLQGVKGVRAALDDFYTSLSDEQKAQFESVGQDRDSSVGQSGASDRRSDSAPRYRRHGVRSVEGMIRHFIAIAR